jgi:putative PIG3 family NAD(P)H quinone oxidoreductase
MNARRMRVVRVSAPGDADAMVLVEQQIPSPAPGEVLIEIEAAGVNRPDLLQRAGRYPPPSGVTDVLGLEVSGRIVAVGEGDAPGPPRSASGHVWQLGERVVALLAGGGYAEFCVVPGVQCLPVPSGLTMIEAAALPETYFTVWANVFERGALRPGEWLMIHGGASGIGTTAIQLSVARGATVIATAGSDQKCRACESLGAIRGVNYRTEDFVAVVNGLTHDRGVDVILDMVGGDYTPRNLASLALDGRLVQIAVMRGATSEISLASIMRRRLTVTGSTLRSRTPAEKGVIASALEREVWPLLAAGRVRPVIDAVFPLADAAAAHRKLESGEVIGKLVLDVRRASAFSRSDLPVVD